MSVMECYCLYLFITATKLLTGDNAFVTVIMFSCVICDTVFVAVKLKFFVIIGTTLQESRVSTSV